MITKPIHWKQLRHHWELYLFILPTILLIGLFQYFPASSGIFHSFFNWNGAEIAEYTGLDNYRDLAKSSDFWNSFRVALILGLWNIIKMIPALLVAVCIHRCRSSRLQFFYRAMFVLPMVIPGLVIALIWRSFFFEATSGYLNWFLHATHLFDFLSLCDRWFGWGGIFASGQSPAWLGDPKLILISCIIWGFPWVQSFAVLTYLAKLQSIPKDIYEAADIDGINWFSKFTHIELPLIMGSIHLLFVFVIIDTFKDAGTILALTGFEGGPGGVVTVPALFMMRKAFIEQKMGYACAIGIVLTVIVLMLQKSSTIFGNWDKYSKLKKNLFRLFPAGLGILMLSGDVLPFLGIGLLLLAIPFPDLYNYLSTKTSMLKANSLKIIDNMQTNQKIRKTNLETELPTRKRLTEASLRSFKHLTIFGVLAFALLPLYLMLIVSIKNNSQFYLSPAVITHPYHWENWITAWKIVTPTVANSIFIAMSSTGLTLIFALGAAYFFARAQLPLSNFFWNAILILMMMPTVANLVPLFRLLKDMDLLNTLTALIIVGASAGQVFAVYVLRNFIADIPQDLFEAAEIDGANHFQQLKTVVIPLSGPILGTVGVMQFIAQWNEFVLPLIIMRDHARLPVMVELLRLEGEYVKFWGPLMAGYAIASIPVIILFLFSMKLFIRGLTEGAVKE